MTKNDVRRSDYGAYGDTKEQLDNDTEALLTTARSICVSCCVKYQQMDGLNTALPYGVRKIDAVRTLTTESLAVSFRFGTGNLSRGRCVLRSECHFKKYDYRQPPPPLKW